jgi:AhpD family alkylhydroperoxidase
MKKNKNNNDMNTSKKNLMEVFQEEAPEVAQAFGGLIQSIAQMPALEPKTKQLIYIAIRASQGETTAVTAHVPMAKQAGATRDELKEAILMTTTVCGVKGIASCLIPALDAYDNAK